MANFDDTNIRSATSLPTPREVKRDFPISPKLQHNIQRFRETVENILDGCDARLIMIVGPCSIHDPAAGLDYAKRLAHLSKELDETLFIIMRVYFEKPREHLGWKGLVSDPGMDDSFRMDSGLRLARKFLLDVANLGLPAGTEALDSLMPQYFGDLISWHAIGARTYEAQMHRELASGLSTPVAFKNGPDGTIEMSVNAMHSAERSHKFLGLTEDGSLALFTTAGNKHPHLLIRGSAERPNYGSNNIREMERLLEAAKLPPRIIVDCGHGNSEFDPRNQEVALDDCLSQIEGGNESITGFMLESNIGWGKQAILRDHDEMDYGVSVTDPCIDWETTERLLRMAHERMLKVSR